MAHRRRGLATYRPIDRRGVSEVIGTVLLLAMTVVVFSGIILFVNSLTGPGNQTYVDLVPSIQRTDPNNGIVFITHAGGQALEADSTVVIIQINGTAFPLAVADGLLPTDGKWVTGQRWQVPFTGNQLSQNATVQVSVIDQRANQVVLLALVQRGIGIGGAYPIIGTAAILQDGYVYNSGAHNFKLRVIAVDYDNDLPRTGVFAEFGTLGCGLVNDTLLDTGFGVFESQTWYNVTSCLPAGTYPVNLTATDLAGHTSRAKVLLEVRSLVPVLPINTGTGPFGWAFTNRFQAFEIYEQTEWDTKRFNGTGTRDFTKGQTVVVAVASQFLKNVDLQNELMLFSPSGLPQRAEVYGGGNPSAVTKPSSTAAFTFEEFVAGYFIYSVRFNTNSAAYGFNGSQLSPGQYNLEITMRTSNLAPPDNRFSTATVINVTEVGGVLPDYPRFEFYKDKDFTMRSNEFNFTEIAYGKITVATTDDTVVVGAITVSDYQGGIQIFAPPGNPPVSDIIIKNSTVYWFALDLASPNRDKWVFETNAYGVKLSQLIDNDEKYALSGQLIIHGPKWGADVISSMREWRNFWRDDRVYSIMYENDNSADWQETYVASYISGSRFTPRWAGRDMLDVQLADMDGDGSLDAVMGSSSGFVLLFRNVDGVGHEWDNAIIDSFGGPDVISVGAGRIDADVYNDVVAGTDNGQIWWYHNDGSWVPLICDRVQGRRSCDVSPSEDSAPVLIANVGSTVRVNDLKLADMNSDGTNDLVAALSNNLLRVYYNDGFGHFGNTVTSDYNMSADSAVQGTVTNSYTHTQSTNNNYETIREVNGTGQSIVAYSAIGEFESLYGQIETGTYANTLAYDGAPYELISETFYSGGGGKWMIRNSTSGSSPGHQYAFGSIPSVSGSDYATVTISAYLSTGTEPFEVRYKVGTGAASSVLGTFTETSMTTKTFTLSGFTGGDLYIVVQDTDITGGDDDPGGDAKQTKMSLDQVRVDVYRANGTTSRLEHKWQTVTVGSAGAAYRLFVEANHTVNNETDDMVFEWSPSSSGPWSPLVTVAKTSDDNGYQNAILPLAVGGTQIWVRATDTNRSANATYLDTLSIDHLFVRRYTVIPNFANISTSWASPELVIGDMNGDGKNDIVAARGLSNGAQIYYGPGFNTSTILTTPVRSYAVDVGHIDGDGQLDVVVGEGSEFVHVFYNLNGTWKADQFADLSPVRNTQTNYLRIGDIDGDGFDDVMLATADGDVLFYRHLQGTGWDLAIVDNLRRPIHSIDIGDVDRGVTFDYSGKLQ